MELPAELFIFKCSLSWARYIYSIYAAEENCYPRRFPLEINSIDHISFLQFTVITLKSYSMLLPYISSKRKTKQTVTPVLSEVGDLIATDTGKSERQSCFHLRFYWCGLSLRLSDFTSGSAGAKFFVQQQQISQGPCKLTEHEKVHATRWNASKATTTIKKHCNTVNLLRSVLQGKCSTDLTEKDLEGWQTTVLNKKSILKPKCWTLNVIYSVTWIL